MKYLLDTNVCIDVLRGKQGVIDRLQEHSPDDCVISSITVYELLSGAQKSRDPTGESAKVAKLSQVLLVVDFNEKAAEHAAVVRADLERRGQKIGGYDVLLAGQALALDLICVTDNISEFSRVNELQLENWRD